MSQEKPTVDEAANSFDVGTSDKNFVENDNIFKEETEVDEISSAFSRLSPKQKTLLLTFLESL